MTPDDLRSRLEALLGPVHLADRAAEALGCNRRSVNRWMQGHQKVPLWVIRHVETVEFLHYVLGNRASLSSRWQKPPPP